MLKQSLQRIMDSYIQRGYQGERLRQALLKDKVYSRLLKERQKKLTKQIKVSKAESQKYVLSVDEDYEILKKCKQLEGAKLTKADKELVKLIKTQLEHDWRGYLIKDLNRLLRKYKEN